MNQYRHQILRQPLECTSFRSKVPAAVDHGAYYQIELVLVEEDKETPLGFKVGLVPETYPDVIDIIIWPSDDPENIPCQNGWRNQWHSP